MAKRRGMTVKDRVGERYGRLVVTGRAENRTEPSGAIRAYWVCLCDCGTEKVVSGQALGRGRTKSCGCLVVEARMTEATHHMSRTPDFRGWHNMVQRCTNPNSTHWKSYGGRGITVCERWLSFESFFADMGPRPCGMTIERIDNKKGYEPGNCRWASRLEQSLNRRTNMLIAFDGEEKPVTQWERELGFPKNTIRSRIIRGWSIRRAMTTPIQDTGRRRRK